MSHTSFDNFLNITEIHDLFQFLVEEENKLFNRRITNFVKVSEQHKLQDLPPIIFSLQNHYPVSYILFVLSNAEKLQHVTSQKRQSTKQPETILEDQEELLNHENVSSTQNTSLSNNKTLLNMLLEGLSADNIEPQQPIDLQFRQSLSESGNS